MAFTITLQPSGLQFAVPEGSTILDAAENAGVALPYGCRNGSCGACRGKVIEGDIKRGIEDRFALTDDERAQGYLLLCAATAQSDGVIHVDDVRRMSPIVVRTMPARIAGIEQAAPDVLVVTLKLPSAESFDFRAGQYVELLFKDGERRAFSLANPPHERGFVQLHIRLAPGSYSARMFTEVLKVRDVLRLEGPLGTFHLNEDSTKPIIMLAGGTGFAPIKSILDDMARRGIRREVHLYRGSRDRAGLYMSELVERWSRSLADFHHADVLSDPTSACAWSGRTGFVHRAVLEDFSDLSAYEVYACGAVAMVEAAHRDFIAHGLSEEAFFADAFTPAKPKK